MDPKLKKALSILFIVLSVAVVVVVAFSNQELANAWDTILSLNPWWLAGILLCWMAYTFFESFGTWVCLREGGYRLPILRVLSSTLLGFYYSNITPGAAGGQPMQVNSLRKAGVPVGYGTMAVTSRFIANQAVVCGMSLFLLIFQREYVYAQLEGAIWFVRAGWAINFASVLLVLLSAYRHSWIQRLLNGAIRLLHRIHLLRDPERASASVAEVLDHYHLAMRDLFRSPGRILTQLGFSLLSLMGLMSSVYFVYHAFGLEGTTYVQLLTMATLLFISVSYTPLPGASGAQEGGFLYYFRGIFTNGTIGLALLVWRFFTYYIFLLVGVVVLLAERFAKPKGKIQP